MSKVKEVPVFLFTGFLESGKTKFIQETLEDKRFNSGERTLLIVCEEGEEEYAPDKFSAPNVFMVNVEEQAELTRANLRKWLDEHDCERCVIEYNGMWMLDDSVSGAARDVDGVSGVFLRRCAQHPQLQRQYAQPCL